jgi:hypothetical protein
VADGGSDAVWSVLRGLRLGDEHGRGLHGFGLVAASTVFEGLAGAGDGEALLMDKALNFKGELNVAAAVEALAGTALVGLQLRELGLPKTQDIGLEAADAGHIADLEVEPIGDGWRVERVFA